MKRIIAMILICLLIGCTALAESEHAILTSGKCNLRSEPSLDGEIVGDIGDGKNLDSTGEFALDDRDPAVAWFKVDYKGESAWISSRYCMLLNRGGFIEIESYIGTDMEIAAQSLLLKKQGDVYGDDAIELAGGDAVERIEISDAGYCFHNILIGNDLETVTAELADAGIEISEETESENELVGIIDEDHTVTFHLEVDPDVTYVVAIVVE